MHTCAWLLWLFLLGQQVCSLPSRFTKIEVFGERCTGTNWFTNTAAINFGKSFVPATHKDPKRKAMIFTPHGWKHGHLNASMFRSALADPADTLGTGHTLFIVLVKNPYAWLESLRRTPHHATWHQDLSMAEFLRKEWKAYYGNWMQKDKKNDVNVMVEDLQPDGETPYANVLRMRTGKMQSHLQLPSLVPHTELIRYEDAMFNGSAVFDMLANKYGLTYVQGSFKDNKAQCGPLSIETGKCKETKEAIAKHQRRKQYYDTQGYLKSFAKSDLNFIREQLDPELEASLGYELVAHQEVRPGEVDRPERTSVDRAYEPEQLDNNNNDNNIANNQRQQKRKQQNEHDRPHKKDRDKKGKEGGPARAVSKGRGVKGRIGIPPLGLEKNIIV